MARGGKRQGTPGAAYSNRTDLNSNRAPSAGAVSPASGGMEAPAFTSPDAVPRLNDPSARPNEPVTAGLMNGAGDGIEALGYQPPMPSVQTLQAAYLANPTPELRRALDFLLGQGAI